MQQVKHFSMAVFIGGFLTLFLVVCGSNKATPNNLGVTSGAADVHCVGVAPQEANVCICEGTMATNANPACTTYAGDSPTVSNSNATDTNTMTNDYGDTMYGAEGDDDDCKYHVKWSMSSVAENSPVTFTVTATRLVENTPLTGAATRAEVFLSTTHPAPNTTPEQGVTEGPPGTYTITPVVFDASGAWTVRFHFYEVCDDTIDNSDHGHAAFYVTIP